MIHPRQQHEHHSASSVDSVFGFLCADLCGHEAQAAAAGIKHMLGVPACGSACHHNDEDNG